MIIMTIIIILHSAGDWIHVIYMLSKYSTSELHPQSWLCVYTDRSEETQHFSSSSKLWQDSYTQDFKFYKFYDSEK